MKTASAIFEDLIENFELIGRQTKALYPRLQELDKELSSIYHTVETSNLSHDNSIEMMTRLQNTLQERRIVKNELEALKSIKESLPFSQVENYLERKKVCRTAIKYYTDYEKAYFTNFTVEPEKISI